MVEALVSLLGIGGLLMLSALVVEGYHWIKARRRHKFTGDYEWTSERGIF